MKNEKLIFILSPWRIIDYIDKVGEEGLPYYEHFAVRLMGTTASEMLLLDAYYQDDLDPENKSYALYIDTRWSDKGFMKCIITEDTKKNTSVLSHFIQSEILNKLLMAIGEDNLWNLAENAGIKVIFTVPAAQYHEIAKVMEQARSSPSQESMPT